MPALRRYGFTATVFVVAGGIGGHNAWDEPGPRKPLMTAARRLRRAADAGMEIGSHGLSARPPPELGDDELVHEVRRSRLLLAQITGGEVTGFCYPYGAVGAREIQAVRDAGYDVRLRGAGDRHGRTARGPADLRRRPGRRRPAATPSWPGTG